MNAHTHRHPYERTHMRAHTKNAIARQLVRVSVHTCTPAQELAVSDVVCIRAHTNLHTGTCRRVSARTCPGACRADHRVRQKLRRGRQSQAIQQRKVHLHAHVQMRTHSVHSLPSILLEAKAPAHSIPCYTNNVIHLF